MDERLILSRVQNLARTWDVYKGTLEKIVEFAVLGTDLDLDAAVNFLRRESTQQTLQQHWEVALWHAIDKSWRLVSLATFTTPDKARARLMHQPPDKRHCCAYCFMLERGRLAETELHQEVGVNGPVAGVYLHSQCLQPWRQLRALAAMADEPAEERNELL